MALRYGHEGTHTMEAQTPLREISKTLPLRVLSDADWSHWTTYGYVVIPDAVPAENIERLTGLLWEFQDMDPNDPATWTAPQLRQNNLTELNNLGMAEVYNHQYLWDNRQRERVYNAFVDIWDREDLWVTIDRAGLNPPNVGGRQSGGFIHWDVDTTERPLPVNVQGVLSLVDTDERIGGFQCVPELFRNFEQWLETQPEDRNPYSPDLTGLDVQFVPMKAGDLLIFNTLLAHGVRPNTSEKGIRMAQYLAMYPANNGNEEARQTRIRSWREREAPQGLAFPGDPRNWEKERYPTAQLNPLGEKLLGLAPW